MEIESRLFSFSIAKESLVESNYTLLIFCDSLKYKNIYNNFPYNFYILFCFSSLIALFVALKVFKALI
jgi:hypothetical protein